MPGNNIAQTDSVGADRRRPSDIPTVPSGEKHGQPGTFVGDYEVGRELGHGSMGMIYLGIHRMLGLSVALKALRPEFLTDPAVCARFQAEARNGANIRSPHVVQIIDLLTFPDGRPCIVMEYCQGRTLDEWAGEAGLPDSVAVPILMQICAGLEATHACGLIHRDIKPQNIILANDDGFPMVKIGDFGIAKSSKSDLMITEKGTALGTPHYMSPEQIRGTPVDARTDIYSLGILAFRLLMGWVPFDAPKYTAVLTQHMNNPPPDMPGVSESLHEVVRCALAKDRNNRYPDVASLRQALKNTLRMSAATTAAEPPPRPAEVRTAPTANSIPARRGAPTVSLKASSGPVAQVPAISKPTVLGPPTFVLVLPHRVDIEYASAESINEVESLKTSGGQLYVPYDGEVSLGSVTLLASAPGAPRISIEAEVALIFGMREATKWNVPPGFALAIRRNARSGQSSAELTPVLSTATPVTAFLERATLRSPKDHFAFLGIPLDSDFLTISGGLGFFARKLDEVAASGGEAANEVLASLRQRFDKARADLSEPIPRLQYNGRIGNHSGVARAMRESPDRALLARLNIEFAARYPNRTRAAVGLIERAASLAAAGFARQAAGEIGRALHCMPLSFDLHRQYANYLRRADQVPETTHPPVPPPRLADPFQREMPPASRSSAHTPTVPDMPIWIRGAEVTNPGRRT